MRNPRPCAVCGQPKWLHDLDWPPGFEYVPAKRTEPLRAPGHVGPAKIKRIQEIMRATGYTPRITSDYKPLPPLAFRR